MDLRGPTSKGREGRKGKRREKGKERKEEGKEGREKGDGQPLRTKLLATALVQTNR